MRLGFYLITILSISCTTMKIHKADTKGRIELVRVDYYGRAIQYLKDKKTKLCWLQDSGAGIEIIDCKYFERAK